MLIAAVIIGSILIMAGVNNTWGDLGSLAKETVWPKQGTGFIVWVFAILFLAAVLRALNLPEAGKALVVLIVVAFLLGHNDVPGQILKGITGSGDTSFNKAVASGGAAPSDTVPGSTAAPGAKPDATPGK